MHWSLYRCNSGCFFKTLEEVRAIIDWMPKHCPKDEFISRLKRIIYHKKNAVELADVRTLSCSCSGGCVLEALKEVEVKMNGMPKHCPKDEFISRLKTAIYYENS